MTIWEISEKADYIAQRHQQLQEQWHLYCNSLIQGITLSKARLHHAMLFSYIISLEQVPLAVASVVTGLTDNKYLFLLIVNIVFLLLGCVLDVSTIQLVFVPMVLPLVKAFGIDLVHFGVVICFNMMIGLSTPPFGMLLFITSQLGKTKLADMIKEIWPMIIIMIVELFLMTYIPNLIMFIPNHLMR